ncbi:hypothetical protein HYALB_00012650 [Hymenoscyphus albidus]|uniref:EKC/KEOPS complex subunit GON7 n=1 Tax=Hymenoscyphus albidus TaxID=595503 RepID=A0A9N9LPW7_9HELO|nr:hypothetical protein HYALB_00012650 [Hymenoscyphus albidus]
MAEQISAASNGTNATKTPTLTATYSSPINPSFTHTQTLPSPAEKTAYLAALRKATAEMQDTINKELTTRMEDDKKLAEGATSGTKIDEAKEEDNYGEEVVEED